MKTIIYHNARCSKSREGLCILEEMGVSVEVRNYLATPPTFEEIDHLLSLLKAAPLDVIRKNESIFKEKFSGKELSRSQWIQAIVEHPVLLERPIVVRGNKAVVGRPPSLIKELLN